ncbi:hypothetical protein KL86SPO_30082 [uncultured Sporomusa sp.]|uniref:Uncharacterized protein n=1 Tax=uncultured Sporomusa sp. TaxID=307249 RepID=A0A212LQE9_9FIRM|nr:hypothetical protein KL86SPO_30082 [uncultured Sporomusa sp.]
MLTVVSSALAVFLIYKIVIEM